MKLKTLKDLDKRIKYREAFEKELRALAIKWAKFYDMCNINPFMKFHNITEEDLQ